MSLSFSAAAAADSPIAKIENGLVEVKLYLPDANHGFYRGTRFDWSGVIFSLRAAGHDYYGPWFTKTDPGVHDFIYQDNDIVAGPCSAITGPVDEFAPVEWEDAKVGGTFVKIGIGALRKPDDQPYDNYRLYEIADGGQWQVTPKPDAIEFLQTLHDSSSGVGYTYRKTIQLAGGAAQMTLRHSLRNTGSRAIHTSIYNHNFLVVDGKPLASGTKVSVPFHIRTPHAPDSKLAAIRDRQIVYLRPLHDRDTAAMIIQGFGNSADDHRIRIENPALQAGMTMEGDRPLLKLSLWSIRSVLAVEPFVSISIAPGEEFRWTTVYRYFALPETTGNK